MDSDRIIHIDSGTIFQGDQLVLHDVDLEVFTGEFVYLIGKTGSGKSSLLKVLYGQLPLQAGLAQVAGFDLEKIKPKEVPFLRRAIGIVFQDFQLLTDRNVDENLAFVLHATGWKNKKEIAARIDEVLHQVGLGAKGYKKPFELSGGEQQRVVIARALLNKPQIILADEPTGNLDPETSDEIIQLIFDLNQESGTAVIMATHDYSIIENFPARIIKCIDETVVTQSSLNQN